MKQIDIRDFTNYHYPTIFTPAPDGKHAVMAVVDASEKDNCYESCLWLYDMETKKTSRLTGGKKERTFIWMDSETVLFIADREKTYQEKAKNEEDWTCFYTLNIHGGEAQFAFAVPYKAVKMKKAGNKLVLMPGQSHAPGKINAGDLELRHLAPFQKRIGQLVGENGHTLPVLCGLQ